MGDWADEKALNLWISGNKDEGIDLALAAKALRQARLDALEEAARMVESGLGEHFTAGHIRALKEKQP